MTHLFVIHTLINLNDALGQLKAAAYLLNRMVELSTNDEERRKSLNDLQAIKTNYNDVRRTMHMLARKYDVKAYQVSEFGGTSGWWDDPVDPAPTENSLKTIKISEGVHTVAVCSCGNTVICGYCPSCDQQVHGPAGTLGGHVCHPNWKQKD